MSPIVINYRDGGGVRRDAYGELADSCVYYSLKIENERKELAPAGSRLSL